MQEKIKLRLHIYTVSQKWLHAKALGWTERQSVTIGVQSCVPFFILIVIPRLLVGYAFILLTATFIVLGSSHRGNVWLPPAVMIGKQYSVLESEEVKTYGSSFYFSGPSSKINLHVIMEHFLNAAAKQTSTLAGTLLGVDTTIIPLWITAANQNKVHQFTKQHKQNIRGFMFIPSSLKRNYT